ncbi:MAG: tripartite tricarboxylate transporter substrate binding protein [Xanthobacteraceae bacterium]|nr:tripartite tricarboxylate transporter substrate binding protein [Xanthobacteraceae bacterium]
MPRFVLLPLKAAAVLVALSTVAAAQDYPVKPIRMIIPFPPGGGSDVTGRAVATALSDRLGKQVIVDNRAGAGGVIGSELAANAPKDGYTLLMVSLAHTVNPWLYDLKGRYDPIRSFTPVAMIAASPVVLVVNPNVPVNSVADLVALARKQPGKLQYASAGVGSVTHLAGELFKYTAKVDMLHVPFKGAGPATIDVVAGHTSLMFGGLLATTPQVRSGKLRAIGMGSLKRNPIFPDVPSIAEAGVPGYETVNWFGLVAPAGTPAAIVERLHREITLVQDLPEVQKQFDADGATIIRMTPAAFGDYMVADMKKWERVVKEGGIKAQ